MTTPINADPMTVYLLIDGEEPAAVPGIVDFNLTVENPEVNEDRAIPDASTRAVRNNCAGGAGPTRAISA